MAGRPAPPGAAGTSNGSSPGCCVSANSSPDTSGTPATSWASPSSLASPSCSASPPTGAFGGSVTASPSMGCRMRSSDYGGLAAMFFTNPTGPIGVSARLGIGDRWLRYSATEGGATSKDLGTTYTDGWDARVALGVPFRVGPLSFVPEVSVGVGALFLYSAA